MTHLTGELLQREAGIKLLLVPYTGGPSHAVTDVATGRVAMIIEGYSGVAGAARSGSTSWSRCLVMSLTAMVSPFHNSGASL